MKLHLLVSLLLCFATSVSAQVEEIVVTGIRAGGYDGMPAITIMKPADFLVQEIRFINDSRSPELRRKEIVATISAMLKSASSDKRIALSYGEGFLEPVSLDDESLQIIEDKQRIDTSTIDIFVKTSLAPGENIKSRIGALRAFIKRAELTGRTEIESRGDIGLSIVNPERYRYEILAKISEENARIVKVMGTQCRIKLDGLEGRVQWERTDVAELTLYIPYATEVADCAYGP